MKVLKFAAMFGALLVITSLSPAFAQIGGGVVMIPPITPTHCAEWVSTNILEDSGGGCGGGGGSGTVTSVATGQGLTGGPITTTGTISSTELLGNSGAAITASTYTINRTTDAAEQLLFTGSGASAWTLGAAVTGVGFDVNNQGTAAVTITATGNINGAATLVIPAGKWAHVYNDGTAWWAEVYAPVDLTSAQVISGQKSNAITTLAISTTTYTPDGSNNNYKIALTSACASAACTLANPSATPVAGTSGVIEFTQPASGGPSAIGTWGSQYIYAGGTSTIAFSTGASALDFLSYYVVDATHVLLTTGALNATH